MCKLNEKKWCRVYRTRQGVYCLVVSESEIVHCCVRTREKNEKNKIFFPCEFSVMWQPNPYQYFELEKTFEKLQIADHFFLEYFIFYHKEY